MSELWRMILSIALAFACVGLFLAALANVDQSEEVKKLEGRVSDLEYWHNHMASRPNYESLLMRVEILEGKKGESGAIFEPWPKKGNDHE